MFYPVGKIPYKSLTSALLIVDVQKGFINAHTEHVVPKVKQLQNQYHHVYATQFTNPEGSPYRRFMGWERFDPSSNEVHLAFKPLPNVRILTKHSYSAATEELLKELETNHIREVHLCGIDTDACVLATAISLFEHGVPPVILSYACASTAGAEYHNAALKILAHLIGDRQVRTEL